MQLQHKYYIIRLFSESVRVLGSTEIKLLIEMNLHAILRDSINLKFEWSNL